MEFCEDDDITRSQDMDKVSDLHSSKFHPDGLLMTYEDEPSFEGYLQIKASAYLCSECACNVCICVLVCVGI